MSWVNAIVQGILLGGLYALFACGLSLLFGVMKVINLAHGDLAILAGYLAVGVVAVTHIPAVWSFIVVVPLFAALGYLAQRIYLRGLYSYPAIAGKVTDVDPDLATALPDITNGGTTYTVTIRTGADWNTSPARQVTGADAVLGLKRSCNPTPTSFGGRPDFAALIVGYPQFCTGFAKGSPTSISAIKTYIDTHNISGVTSSGNTVTYKLTQPTTYFPDMLTLPAFNPAPVESLNYLPGSLASETHQYADGPYEIKSYVPTKSIVFVRNPAWNASTDPIRKAYVNQINVSETGNAVGVQQILASNTSSGGMEFNAFPPEPSLPGLISQMQNGSKDFNLGPSYGSNPFLVPSELISAF